jgi:hypothetical protein
VCSVAVALAAFAAAAQEPKEAPKRPPNPRLVQRGTYVMENLKSGNFSAILDQMQHPPTYTKEELAEDRRAISVALQFLSSGFGRLESYALSAEPVESYSVSLAMGPPEYWAQIPETELGSGITFTSRHAKVGSAIVRITEAYTESEGWIRSLEFGIPATVPGARDRMTRLAREMVSRMESATRKPKPKTPPPQPE